MFKFGVYGKRVGRIAFGVVLLVGTVVLVLRVTALKEDARGADIIAITWGAALAAYAIVGWLGSRRPLDHAGQLAIPSLVVPSLGAALLLPLTLHLLFALGIYGTEGFDEWVVLSFAFTTPTHLVFAGLAAARARQLATGAKALSPVKIYGICVGVSCVPFALFVLPPIIVMMTGLPLLWLLAMMEPLALRDRERAAAEALPRAIAVLRG